MEKTRSIHGPNIPGSARHSGVNECIGKIIYEHEDNQDLLHEFFDNCTKGDGLMEWLYSKGIPIEAQYLYRKAHEMADQGKDETALKYYRQALIIAPKYSNALFEMGNCFAHLEMYTEALTMYERAIHINPESKEIAEKRDMLRSFGNKKRR
jgi:tetratricopeptide (TPR) repeat protein